MRELRRRDLLLIALTFAAGSVDAVALLRLDVFTAVMTGNIVLLGLAVGQGAFGMRSARLSRWSRTASASSSAHGSSARSRSTRIGRRR